MIYFSVPRHGCFAWYLWYYLSSRISKELCLVKVTRFYPSVSRYDTFYYFVSCYNFASSAITIIQLPIGTHYYFAKCYELFPDILLWLCLVIMTALLLCDAECHRNSTCLAYDSFWPQVVAAKSLTFYLFLTQQVKCSTSVEVVAAIIATQFHYGFSCYRDCIYTFVSVSDEGL